MGEETARRAEKLRNERIGEDVQRLRAKKSASWRVGPTRRQALALHALGAVAYAQRALATGTRRLARQARNRCARCAVVGALAQARSWATGPPKRARSGGRGRPRARAELGWAADARWAAALAWSWAASRGPTRGEATLGRAEWGEERGDGAAGPAEMGQGRGGGLISISPFLSLFYLFQFDIMCKLMIK
jgi:hypothetical protein